MRIWELVLPLLLVASLLIGCGGSDDTASPAATVCDGGKISLHSRLETVEGMIASCGSASPETECGQLELEARIVESIVAGLDALKPIAEAEYVAIDTGDARQFYDIIRWIQKQLTAVYVEAGYFQPEYGSYRLLMMERLFDSSVPLMPGLVNYEKWANKYDRWIGGAANFDPDMAPDWFENVIVANDFTRLDLAMQLFTLLLQQDTWPEYNFGAERMLKIESLVDRAVAEMAVSTLPTEPDCWMISAVVSAGYGALIEPEWIERIVAWQLPDGMWPYLPVDSPAEPVAQEDLPPPDLEPDVTATNLVLWALAKYQVYLQCPEEFGYDMFPFNPCGTSE